MHKYTYCVLYGAMFHHSYPLHVICCVSTLICLNVCGSVSSSYTTCKGKGVKHANIVTPVFQDRSVEDLKGSNAKFLGKTMCHDVVNGTSQRGVQMA